MGGGDETRRKCVVLSGRVVLPPAHLAVPFANAQPAPWSGIARWRAAPWAPARTPCVFLFLAGTRVLFLFLTNCSHLQVRVYVGSPTGVVTDMGDPVLGSADGSSLLEVSAFMRRGRATTHAISLAGHRGFRVSGKGHAALFWWPARFCSFLLFVPLLHCWFEPITHTLEVCVYGTRGRYGTGTVRTGAGA